MKKKKGEGRAALQEYSLDVHIEKERKLIDALEMQKLGAELVLKKLVEQKEQRDAGAARSVEADGAESIDDRQDAP